MKMEKESKPHTLGICSSTSKGLILGFISGLIFSLTTVIVKYLKDIYPGQLTAYRYLAISLFILPDLVLSQENPLGPTNRSLSVVILAISSAAANFLMFVASRYLPLGEASALVSCNPVFITIAGKIFLKESFGLVQLAALSATVIGIVLITGVYQTMIQNSRVYTTENIYGLGAALGSLTVATIFMTLTRKLSSRNTHYSVILFISGIVGVIVSVILTALSGNFSVHYCGLLVNGLIILLGVLSHLALLTLTIASRYGEAGSISTMRAASDIFSSFVLQVAFFRDIPDAITVSGAVLVCTAIVLVGFTQKINTILPAKYRSLC